MLRSQSPGYKRLGSGRRRQARAENDGVLNSTIPLYLVALVFFGILALPSSRQRFFRNGEPAHARLYLDEDKVRTLSIARSPLTDFTLTTVQPSPATRGMTGEFRPLDDATCVVWV